MRVTVTGLSSGEEDDLRERPGEWPHDDATNAAQAITVAGETGA